jgi:hypothetical protein
VGEHRLDIAVSHDVRHRRNILGLTWPKMHGGIDHDGSWQEVQISARKLFWYAIYRRAAKPGMQLWFNLWVRFVKVIL